MTKRLWTKRVWIAACVACGAACAQRGEPVVHAGDPVVHAGDPETKPPGPWSLPAGFRSETFAFPLPFAPTLRHTGVEELRFAPGFFDPTAPGYWSYALVWRTDDSAELDAAALGDEITAYFRGLIREVDDKHEIADIDSIAATATRDGKRFALAVHIIDAFKTKQPVDLAGWAERRACARGAVWVFVLAPGTSGLRPQLDAVAADAACGQPVLSKPEH